jgi:predicted methyltransferase
MLRPLVSALAVAATLASAPLLAADKALQAAVASPSRTPANVQRDVYRHPYETLTFFGLKPWMDVVEISPSGGWYTEILAPYLAAEGAYTAAHNNPAASPKAAESVAKFKARFADPGYGKINVTAFGKGVYDIAPAGSQDMVVSFRNVHNWYMGDYAPEAFKAFYKALKPGGTLGIVEHRLPEGAMDGKMKDSGYMKPSYIKKLAEDAGFRFVASSEVNANPKDTKDYPKGVWTLPPNYAEGDKDKAKYTAIGESDRVTMKFVKPKKTMF